MLLVTFFVHVQANNLIKQSTPLINRRLLNWDCTLWLTWPPRTSKIDLIITCKNVPVLKNCKDALFCSCKKQHSYEGTLKCSINVYKYGFLHSAITFARLPPQAIYEHVWTSCNTAEIKVPERFRGNCMDKGIGKHIKQVYYFVKMSLCLCPAGTMGLLWVFHWNCIDNVREI